MNFLLSPIQTFFNRDFYKQISQTPLKKGWLYLLYLSAITTVFGILGLMIIAGPQIDRAVDWIKKEMPVISFSPEGLSMDKESPYVMNYPGSGQVAYFDMTKDELPAETISKTGFYATRAMLYTNNGQKIETVLIKKALEQRKRGKPTSGQVTPEMVGKLYAKFKPVFYLAMVVALFIVFFVWKTLAALFYSLMALGFNQMRSQKLAYGDLLDLTIYAMTPTLLFQMIRWVVPVLARIPFLSILDISITLAYLYFAVKMSEGEAVAS